MTQQTKHFYDLGDFRLDSRSRLLTRGGAVVPLKRKAVETLLVLVERRGEVLEKEELMRLLWPDTFVEEANLTQNIYLLRKVLGAGAIETVPRRGYRFTAPVREWSEPLAEVVVRESTEAHVVIDEEEVTTPRVSRRTLRLAAVAAIVIVIAAVAVIRRNVDARQSEPIDSIAVLPFHSIGAADTTLGMGMADTLITKLSASGRLIVRPTSSVLRYADARRDISNAGRDLGVDSLLDGSIQRQDDRLRVTVRLIRTSDGTALWAGQFDERVTDIFAMQDSIAEKVISALALQLSPEQQQRMARRPTGNTDAYQLYAKGRFFWSKRTEEGLRKSIEYFQRAIEIDPLYALAYAGLADAYVQLPGYGPTASMEVYPKAKAAATRALELDGSLAEAHNATAGVLSYFEWNWQAAEDEYRKAIALEPSFAIAHQRLGVQLAAMNRPAEALRELERARELDPQSLIINALVGFAYFENRQFDRAIAELRETIEMDPHFPPAHEFLAHVHEARGNQEAAFAEFTEWRRLVGDPPERLEALRAAFAAKGQRGFDETRLRFLLEDARHQRVQSTDVAMLYSRLGDRERALAWLERAVEQHEGEVLWIQALPDYATVRSDARFAGIAKRINLTM